jgi:hypothetical protein
MICRGNRISLYSLNGVLLLDQAVCETAGDCIISCAFYEGVNNEWLERELLFTGHKRGLVNVRSLSYLLRWFWVLMFLEITVCLDMEQIRPQGKLRT